MKRKWLVSLLVCILTICMLSVTAFAAEGETAAVAKIGEKEYKSLQEALDAATATDTVVLLTDLKTTNHTFIRQSLTLDLNNHEIESSGQSTILLWDQSDASKKITATVKNGTLIGGTYCTVWAFNTADLTLDNVNITTSISDRAVEKRSGSLVLEDCNVYNSNGGGIYDFNAGNKVTLKNSTVTANYFAITHNGSTAGFTLTAENSTIVSNHATACAIYLSASSSNSSSQGMNNATLTGCTVIGPTGIEGKYTNMELNSCNITATGEASFEQYNSGSTSIGFAVVSSDNSMEPDSPKPSATITINGGSYEGLVGLSNLISTDDYSDFAEASITVTGGKFTADVSDYLADNVQNVEYHTVLKAATCTETGIGKLIKVVDGKENVSYYTLEAAGHKEAEAVKENEAAATCTKDGSYDSVVYCSVCEAEISRETVEEKAHHTEPETGVTVVDPTCATAGSKTYTCSACSTEVKEEIPATGKHAWESKEYVPATCTENGRADAEVCKDCGALNPEKQGTDLGSMDPATGHDWKLAEDAASKTGYKAPTCTADGKGEYVCSNCKETETRAIPKLGHTPGAPEYVAPTCTKNGQEVIRCTVCKGKDGLGTIIESHDLGSVDPAKGHTEVVVEGKAATCSATGLTEGKKCSVCGTILVKQQTIAKDPDNHTYECTELKAATCTENGIGKYVCSGCKDSYYAVVPAYHKYNEGTVITAATCGKPGEMLYTCTREGCSEDAEGHTKTEVIPATEEHTWVDGEYVPATCTENGKDGGQVCKVCGAVNPENPPADLGEVDPATGHDWKLDKNATGDGAYKAATCTEDGVETYKCSVCNETEIRTISATGHKPAAKPEYIKPTCTENGKEIIRCTKCKGEDGKGTIISETDLGEVDPATGKHTEQIVPGKAATCKENGLTEGKICSVCGATLVGQEMIPASAEYHKYEATTLKDGTCTSAGVAKYTCSVCGDYYYATTTIKHTAGDDVEIVSATCGKEGSKTYKCTICGEKITEVLPIEGEHDFKEAVIEATCTENAKVGLVCSVCGETKGDLTEVPDSKIPHDYEVTEIVEAESCLEAGYKVLTCKVCEDTKTEEIPAVGKHTEVAVDAKEATCGEAGYEEGVKCSVCGEILFGCAEIPATGEHTEVEIPAVPATCKEGGKTAGVKCSVCDAVLTEPEDTPIDENGHDYEVTVLKPATCTTTGVGKYVCKLCGESHYGVIEKAEHTIDESTAKVTKAATCTEDGVLTFKCSVCNADVTKPIEAQGHKWVEELVSEDNTYIYRECSVCGVTEITEWINCPHENTEIQNAKDATCTEAGYTGDKVCADCGKTIEEGEEIPALNHKDTEIKNAKEATCTEAGYTGDKVCTRCGETIEKGAEIAAKGHTAGEAVVENEVAATCTEEGSYEEVVYCTACKAEISRTPKTTNKAEHTPVVDEAKAPTCEESGLTEGYHCSVCGETLIAQEEIPAIGYGEIAALTEGGALDEEDINKLVFANISLNWFPKDDSEEVQRPVDGWWVGAIINVPEDYKGDAKISTDGGETWKDFVDDKYADDENDPTYMSAWMLVNEAKLSAALEAKENISYSFAFNWDGIEGADQTFVIEIDPANVTLLDENGEELVFQTKEGKIVTCPHKWDEGKITKEATCTEEGEKTFTCSICGETTIAKIEKIAHSEEIIPGKAATCTEAGLTDGVKCSVCGETLLAQEEIEALGHKTEIQNAKAATCTEAGYTGDEVCTVCHEIVKAGEEIAALGHTWDDGVITREPTCELEGERTYTCSVCKATETKPIDKAPHHYIGVLADDGKSITYTCKWCGDHFIEML